MLLKICFLFVEILTVYIIGVKPRIYQVPDYHYVKVCNGEIGGYELSYSKGDDVTYQRIKAMYSGCTHIIGNLVIMNLQEFSDLDSSKKLDYSFFESIVEVNGIVIIHSNSMSRLPLTNLRVIRGLKTYVENKTKSNALYIGINNLGKKNYLKEIDLRSLQSIVHGNVYIDSNPGLCYIPNTINWDYILEDNTTQKSDVQSKKFNIQYCKGGSSCHNSCPIINNKRYCWGPLPEQCQKIVQCNRSECGKRRCYLNPRAPNMSLCCDKECTGGCKSGQTHSGATDCVACKNFLNNKECVSLCPQKTVYNPYSRMGVPNSNAKIPFGSFCVKRCPEYSIIKENSCEAYCDLRKNVLNGGQKCVPCPGGKCNKTNCIIEEKLNIIKRTKGEKLYRFSKFVASRSLLKVLRGCKQVQGDLRVFDVKRMARKRNLMHEIARVEDFYNLKDVEVWNGFIHLDLNSYPEMTNLSFLSNLETIRSLDQGLQVSRSNLVFLGLKSLKYLVMEKFYFFNNKRLCFLEKMRNKRFKLAHFVYHAIKNNEKCKEENLVCDENCDNDYGCWGPGPNLCVRCRNLTVGSTCVSRCEKFSDYFYDPNSKQCKRCHEECQGGCSGPEATHCKGCKHGRLGSTCVIECPPNTYLNESSTICLPCSSKCNRMKGRWCTGPSDKLGVGGCISCPLGRILENNQSYCVETCPKNYYASDHILKVNDTATAVFDCLPCHHLCDGCSRIAKNCIHCRHFKHEDKCVQNCPPDDTYAAEYSNITKEHTCKSCDKQCRNGCFGPGPKRCKACKTRKLYLNPEETIWLCNSTCPDSAPHAHLEDSSEDSVCRPVPVSNQITPIALGSGLGAFVVVCLIVGVIICVCVQRRRALDKKKCELLQARYRRHLDDQLIPLNETDQQPNFVHLRIIGANQLTKGCEIGSGAFGTVFVGIWRPSKERPTDTQVDIKVAIKTLKDSGGEGLSSTVTNEFLSEAHVMASVEHPFCISLLGVCMSSQMQLISEFMPLGSLADYLPRHRTELGSQQLLTWIVQISKGMAYLESRGIIHRDLAARNVLLQSIQQVRITDFGLAKLMDEQENGEFTAEGGRFPVKWLAIECLRRRLFSHKSDVWAFGVTMWEVCTMGQRPYQDLRAADLIEYLERGERLRQPDICTLDMYMMMIKCWLLDADSRPTFEELVIDLSKMASDPARFLVIQHDTTVRISASNRSNVAATSANTGRRLSPNPPNSTHSATPNISHHNVVSGASASVSSSDETTPRKPFIRNPPAPHGLPHLTDEVNRRKAENPLHRLNSEDLRYAADPMLHEESNEVFADYLTPTEDNNDYLLPRGLNNEEYLEADMEPSTAYYNETAPGLGNAFSSYVNAENTNYNDLKNTKSGESPTDDDYISSQEMAAGQSLIKRNVHNPEYISAPSKSSTVPLMNDDSSEEDHDYLSPLDLSKRQLMDTVSKPQRLDNSLSKSSQDETNVLPSSIHASKSSLV